MSRAAIACALLMCAVAVSGVAAADDHPAAAIDAYQRGVGKQRKGDLDGAIADYTKAIEIDPQYADAYSNRGFAKSAKGDRDGAIADCTKAIEIDPRHADAYANRGNVKWNSRDFEGAAADLKKATEIDAANDYARFLLFLSEAAGAEGMATARENLEARRAARGEPMEKGSWVETVDRFLGGEISAEELSKAADASPEKDRVGNRCESLFYSGMLAWVRGDKAAAEDLLRKCVATDEKATFIECHAAKAVLAWPK